MKNRTIVFAILFLILSAFAVAAAKDSTQKIHPALNNAKGAELVPVIIEFDAGAEPDKEILKAAGCKSRHVLKSLNGISAECPADAILQLASLDSVSYLWEDAVLGLALDQSVPLINATAAWQSFGNGAGINVSIIDSGINTSHPALAGQVILENDFTPEGSTDDRCNHGTPVACIVSCNDSTYKGVAPGAKLFNAKVARVISEDPLQCGILSSDAIAAIDWSIEHGAQVIQMSVGSAVSSCYQSALAVAVNNSGKNVTIVIPAGNGGPGNQSIWTPGCAENALSVGASNGNSVEDYSSRGPTDYGLSKPDVVAPGTVTAANNDGSTFGSHTGTSFASPHAAGVVALMLAQKQLTIYSVKQIIKSTAVSLGYDSNTQGAGRIDAWAAVNATVGWTESPFLETAQKLPAKIIVSKQFTINATVTNSGSGAAMNVVSVLRVPLRLTIIDGAARNIGVLQPNSAVLVHWNVSASKTGAYYANITTNASNAQTNITYFTINVVRK